MGRINVNYPFYVESHGGSSISEEEFSSYSMDAEQIVNKITYGRIHRYDLCEDDLEAVRHAICAVADILSRDFKSKVETGGRTVKSINTDGESVTYADAPSGMTEDELLYQRCYTKAKLYLEDTTLLYPGVHYDYQ